MRDHPPLEEFSKCLKLYATKPGIKNVEMAKTYHAFVKILINQAKSMRGLFTLQKEEALLSTDPHQFL